ncbi:MAG TPA: hypothetical protein VM782_03725, partial [Stellaceae bacterium]|nr:hypothetical protein [Stellaceae bacterium]
GLLLYFGDIDRGKHNRFLSARSVNPHLEVSSSRPVKKERSRYWCVGVFDVSLDQFSSYFCEVAADAVR